MRTEYIDSWQRSFTNTYEAIKSELLPRKPELPNPAVYAIETSLNFRWTKHYCPWQSEVLSVIFPQKLLKNVETILIRQIAVSLTILI